MPLGVIRHVCERYEDECSLDHARMRERELGIVGLGVLEEQYIDIERARAKAEFSHPAVLALDALAFVQQVQRLQTRLETDDLVEEGVLLFELLGRRLVDPGSGDDAGGGERRERFARGAQVPRPVAEVRAEGHEGAPARRRAERRALGDFSTGDTHAVRTTSTRAA